MNAADLKALRDALPVGSENGTTVSELTFRLGWDIEGRKVRRGMQILRREEHLAVAGLPEPGGVFIVDSEADLGKLKRTRNGLHSRAMKLHVTVKDLDEIIADFEWSPTLFDAAAVS
jgi:hypothetical protein